MILNPVVYGAGSGNIYHFQADEVSQTVGFPENGSAKAGEYVVSTSGSVSGAIRVLTADKQYVIANNLYIATTLDELPPLARKKLENVPTVMAPPPSVMGYVYFVMPEEDVYIEAY